MNLATWIVLLILIGIVYCIIYSIYKDAHSGKSTCGCNCAGCKKASCHSSKSLYEEYKKKEACL